MGAKASLLTALILGALIGVIFMGGPLLLAALAISSFLTIRQWSQTIKPLDRSSINILTLAGAIYLAEVYLTLGLSNIAILVPFFVLMILLAWQFFAKQADPWSHASELIALFLLIPYSLSFVIIIRELPDLVGFWTVLAILGTSVVINQASVFARSSAFWLRSAGSILLGLLTGALILNQIDYFEPSKTIWLVSTIDALTGYFGLVIFQALKRNQSPAWLPVIFSVLFSAPTMYFALTVID